MTRHFPVVRGAIIAVVEPTFSTRPDGVIDIDLGPEWRPFTETLMDAVTTRAPRGSVEGNPSTYWLDRAAAAIDADERDTGKPFLEGNATELLRSGDEVVARSQYELFDDQSMSVEQFRGIVRAWRDRVEASRYTE